MANPVDMKYLEIPKSLHREALAFDLLDNTNYGVWRKNVQILLMGMCLINLVDHDRPQDADGSWGKADKWAFSEIYFRCKPETQASLTDNMSANQVFLGGGVINRIEPI